MQYKEVFNFISFLNDFSSDELDTISNENYKYLYIVAN